MENGKGSDKEKYSTISIADDDDFEEKSLISKTLEIPKIILSKPLRRFAKKEDYFHKAVRYNPDPAEGLNSLQVDERQVHGLTNRQAKTLSKSYLKIFCDNIFTFFNILLVFIGICLLSVGDVKDCFFLVIITCNTVIGIAQEMRAKQIVDRLSLLNVPEVKVRRDGQKVKIPTDKMVLDEIFYLAAGNEVPADAFIVKGEVEVNEASLTGESLPIKKRTGDYLLAGSYIVSGSCLGQCDRIGEHNYIAQLQNKARKVKKVKSVLLMSLNRIIKWVSLIILPVGVALAVNYYFSGGDMDISDKIEWMIRKTGAQVVTMIPSGLFLLISTTLTVSVINLAKRKTMVQDAYAIESLARSDVICLDKTGTLTDGTMRVEEEILLSDPEVNLAELMGSFLGAFDAQNVTSEAMLKKYPKNDALAIRAVLPFSSARKLSAVEFEAVGTFLLGAPEFLTDDDTVLQKANPYLEQGFRVLLLGRTKQQLHDDIVFDPVEPIAFFILSDHIREEAYDTIRWFGENRVSVRIISGDNPQTVSKIAEKVGVPGSEKYISLDGMTNEEVVAIATDYIVFGRVSPEQKAVLIKALKTSGHTVAMTGDGVNDILAMKQADCSIAMASGAEAARNASHLVLMDSNFSSMPEVVKEGRKVINNIQRSSSLFLMKTLYSILFAALGLLSILLPWDLSQPFDLNHLYVLEFFVIGFPSLGLALQPCTELISGSFMKNVLSKALPGGVALLLSVLTVIIVSHFEFFEASENHIMVTMASLALSFTGLVILFDICRPFTKFSVFLYGLMFVISLIWMLAVPSGVNSLYPYELSLKNYLTVGAIVLVVILYFVIYNSVKRVKNKQYAPSDQND